MKMLLSICAAALVAGAATAAAPQQKTHAAPKPSSAAWLERVPSEKRAELVTDLKKLIDAEAHEDWSAVYSLRAPFDREIEDQQHFVERWPQVTPVHILDFEPVKTTESFFGGVSSEDRVFDILGCTEVEAEDKRSGQEGGITVHLDGEHWYMDGVHLMNTSVGRPEPCTFHSAHGLLSGGHQRH